VKSLLFLVHSKPHAERGIKNDKTRTRPQLKATGASLFSVVADAKPAGIFGDHGAGSERAVTKIR
jgi:hypothetical protein